MISTRNVIEIVAYLKQAIPTLLFTLDGKEYITEKQLEKEIREEVEYSGGRIKRSDLETLLNMDISHIERLTDKMKEYDIISGEILTSEYLESVYQEINETLQESGLVEVSSLSERYGLPTEFLIKLINKKGMKMSQNTLYTPLYIEREKSKMKGYLSSIVHPTLIGEIRKEFLLFDEILKDLLKEKKINGVISKEFFVPKVYESSVLDYIQSNLTASGYIEYSRIEKLLYGYGSLKNYLGKIQNLILLRHFAITKNMKDLLNESIQEAIQQNSPLDLLNIGILPLQFNLEDLSLLLNSFKLKDVNIFQSVLFPTTLLNEWATDLKKLNDKQKLKWIELKMKALSVSDESIYEEIIEYLAPIIEEMIEKEKQEIYLQEERDRKKKMQENEKKILQLMCEIELNYKGLITITNKDLQANLEKYLFTKKCQELVQLMITDQCLYLQIEKENPKLFKLLPKEISNLKNISKLDSFIKEYSTNQTLYYYRPIDKKKEKNLLLNRKYELKEAIKKIQDPDESMILLVEHFYLLFYGVDLFLNGKMIHDLKDSFKDKMSENDFGLFLDTLQLVSNYLKKDPDAEYPEYDEMIKKLDQLKNLELK